MTKNEKKKILSKDEAMRFWFSAQERPVYDDYMLEFYYQKLKEYYLDYYTVFEEMGINENDVELYMNKEEYQEAYNRAESILLVKGKAQLAKGGIEGGNNTSLNSFIRDTEKRTKEENFISGITGKQKEVVVPKKRARALKLNSSKDDPRYVREASEPQEVTIDSEEDGVEAGK